MQIKLEDMSIPENSTDSWVCEIIATERSWEHSRRKRRLMQRQLALKKLKGEFAENDCSEFEADIDVRAKAPSAEESNERLNNNSLIKFENNAENRDKESSDKKSDEPLLVCTLRVERGDIECEKGAARDTFRIQMTTDNGGTDALHSLRQYLINRLQVRNKILDNLSICAKKKRKRNMKKPHISSIRQS